MKKLIICRVFFWGWLLIALAGVKLLAAQDALIFPPGITPSQVSEGWISLFDGESLYGWRAESNANWRVEDGEIRVDQGELGLLRTTTQFDDFELELEFRADRRTNSGIFFRTSPSPRDPTFDCFELNIANPLDSDYPTGSLVERVALKDEIDPSHWTPVRIVALGDRIEVVIGKENGMAYLVEGLDGPLGRGFIGLQYNSGAVAFRHIRLKPLNLTPIEINAELDHWDTALAQTSRFTVADRQLTITGGPGQIETKQTYADFVCSLKCRTNANGLNSGIFFRCIPGELMNGYESQIENRFHDNDRTRPVDCGTGGIFRRYDARRVNANDLEWFDKTIIAVGPHISVWVNGYQVSDWTDRRSPDVNPRQGLRLEAGSIIIQGHDPTTDISFKDFRVREIEPRQLPK